MNTLHNDWIIKVQMAALTRLSSSIIEPFAVPFDLTCLSTLHVPFVRMSTPDVHTQETNPMSGFDVPVDASLFSDLLGSQILSGKNMVSTGTALKSSRLVGLYFSAHWCPPCRRFKPMLIEMYNHLKEERPAHGLEIVYVSSDRDPYSFDNQSYGSMPWLAVPFQTKEQELKMR